jgi:hypothetical protein
MDIKTSEQNTRHMLCLGSLLHQVSSDDDKVCHDRAGAMCASYCVSQFLSAILLPYDWDMHRLCVEHKG